MDSMQRPTRISPKRDVYPEEAAEIERLYDARLRPAQILKEVRKTFKGRFEGDAGRKQVDRIVNEDLAPDRPDKSGRWRFDSANDPQTAPLALAVLGHINKWSDGNVRCLTKREAELIIRIRLACPRMLLHDVWHFTQEYLARTGDEPNKLEDTTVLEEIELFIATLRLAHEPPALLEPVSADLVTLAQTGDVPNE